MTLRANVISVECARCKTKVSLEVDGEPLTFDELTKRLQRVAESHTCGASEGDDGC